MKKKMYWMRCRLLGVMVDREGERNAAPKRGQRRCWRRYAAQTNKASDYTACL